MPDAPDQPMLLRAAEGGVVKLTLNRPQAFNSLSEALIEAIQRELDRIEADDDARVLVLRGNGKAFSAGHDLKEMGENRTREDLARLFQRCSAMMTRLAKLPVPVVAVVDGIATAAGCQLVAACDLAVASDRARFATSGVKYGLFCSTPMVALSRNVPRKPALEMLLTGDFIDAATAERHGLVNEVAPAAQLEDAVGRLTARLVDKPKDVLALGKRAFYAQLEMGLEEAYAFTTEAIVDNALMADFDEGLTAFKEKRQPRWNAS
jgi:enoyl-CoA hydratase/carnithine racemase